jgi:catechol 2,3-dioxygenase-like lactoylglutathione lyase family enzyme
VRRRHLGYDLGSGRLEVRITGLVFVGTRTDARPEMAGFVRNVLGLVPDDISGVDADMFVLADGSSFAVAAADGLRGERTVGFLVEDLDVAVAELRAAHVEIDDQIAANERFRYVHFRAPDGQLYELVEVRSG